MALTRRNNGFIRLAALGVAVPLLVGAASIGTARQPGTDPADTIKKMEEQRKKENPSPAAAPPAAPSATPPTAPAATPPGTAPAPRPSPSGADAIVEPATTGTRLLRENTFITQRRGRLTRSMTSEWVFTMDSDGKGKSEPAMVLMPCMNLQNMEKTVERAGEGTSFTVSGTVYVYKGRNYLLPSMYVVNRRSDLAPAQ